jgi:hypothetical protein
MKRSKFSEHQTLAQLAQLGCCFDFRASTTSCLFLLQNLDAPATLSVARSHV